MYQVISIARQRLKTVQQATCSLSDHLCGGQHGPVNWWDQVLLQPQFCQNQLYEEQRLLVTQSIQERIAAGAQLVPVLRMVGMVGMTSNGFHSEDLQSLRCQMVRVYGVRAAAALDNMEKLGMLQPRQELSYYESFGFAETRWAKLRSVFALCIPPEEPDAAGLGAAFQQYVPLLVRTLEFAVTDRWRETCLELVPGKIFEARHRDAQRVEAAGDEESVLQAVVVVLIGGISESELASLRALGRKEGREYIVITTSIISGSQLMESFEMDWGTQI